MPLSKVSEIRELSDEELQDQIVEAKKQLFDLRFQKATRQLEKHHQFKHTRHRLAQLLTVERERELQKLSSSTASGSETTDTSADETDAE
jgi:large subunit ribosomal protein L29